MACWGEDPAGALADFDRARALNPDHAQARRDRAFLKLSLGDWPAGWADHEGRLKERDHPHNTFMKMAPQWQGEPLAGKRLLVYSEQGDGETFQFCRYLRLIENSGARDHADGATRRCGALLAENFPGIDVIDAAGPLPDFDCHEAS